MTRPSILGPCVGSETRGPTMGGVPTDAWESMPRKQKGGKRGRQGPHQEIKGGKWNAVARRAFSEVGSFVTFSLRGYRICWKTKIRLISVPKHESKLVPRSCAIGDRRGVKSIN